MDCAMEQEAASPISESPTATADAQATRLHMQHAAIALTVDVATSINQLSIASRSMTAPSVLKPSAGTGVAFPDVVGETIAFQHLERLSCELGCEVRVIVDVTTSTHHTIGNSDSRGQHIWCYLDAVDGTVKVAGLGNKASPPISSERAAKAPPTSSQQATKNQGPLVLRVGNDGAWGVGVAFTDPTLQSLEHLTIGDFSVSVILDANPPTYESFPSLACARRVHEGFVSVTHHLHTHTSQTHTSQPSTASDCVKSSYASLLTNARPLCTSSNTSLGQSFVYLDSFQAFDRKSNKEGDEQLAVQLYGKLMNRNEGGAFDVLRMYGNLSALVRTMLGFGTQNDACMQLSCEQLGATGSSDNILADESTQTMLVADVGHAAAGRVELMGHIHCERPRIIKSENQAHRHTECIMHEPQLDENLPYMQGCLSSIVHEPQCAAFLVVNENLPNMLPCVAVVVGAGGVATDFGGQPLLGRRLVEGRTSVVYAANRAIHAQCMRLIAECVT